MDIERQVSSSEGCCCVAPVGDDHGNDGNEEQRLAPAGLQEGKADAGLVEEQEEQEGLSPRGVIEPMPGDGSQESNKSCRVM